MASNEGRVHFSLAGYNFNPDDITRVLGIEPTAIDSSGALRGLDKPAISSWELSTDKVADGLDIFSLTDELIKLIEPKKDKLMKLIEGYNLAPRIGVVLLLSSEKGASKPEVGFGSRTIRFLAEIGAFIDIDYQISTTA
jgi:hypothetical protein